MSKKGKTKKDKPKEKLAEKMEKLAYEYEQDYGGCTQSVLAAGKDVLNLVSDDLFEAGTGLAGGLGLTGKTCGALIGGSMILRAASPRSYDNMEDPEEVRFVAYKMVKELCEKFEEEYGTVNCYEIQEEIMGDSYNLWDEEEYEAFEDAGGHDDKCPSICGKAAKWTVKILKKRNLIE